MMCCGKERTTPFCPNCGKAMDKRAGLLGLVRYLTQQLESAQKKAKAIETETTRLADSPESRIAGNYWHVRLIALKKDHAAAMKKVEKWKDWQEELIRLIDGE